MIRLALALVFATTSVAIAIGGANAAAKKNGAALSLDPKTGYFHQLHTKKLKLNCNGCHSTQNQDILFLRKDDVVPATMRGQVDRSICMGCHTAPSNPAWYGLSKQ